MGKILKWVGIILGGLIGVVVIALVTIVIVSNGQMNRAFDFPTPNISVADDEASIDEGRRLAITRGCTDCHQSDLSGQVILDDPVVGRFTALNLTPGEGGISDYTDGEVARAIVYGVDNKGKPLVIMPSHEYYAAINDTELGLIVSYLRSVAPVNNELPDSQPRLLGHFLNVMAPDFPAFPAELIDTSVPRASVQVEASIEYGAQLANACIGCHGSGLSGGIDPNDPTGMDSANITPHETGIGSWTEDDFTLAMRAGTRPDGTTIDSSVMPWPNFTLMTDDEIRALWLYLQTVEPTEYGNR